MRETIIVDGTIKGTVRRLDGLAFEAPNYHKLLTVELRRFWALYGLEFDGAVAFALPPQPLQNSQT